MQRVALVVFGLVAFAALVFFLANLGPSGGSKYSGPNPAVVMETSEGEIVIELFPDKSPITVANFLKHVDDKHYDGTIFHRVIKTFMIQGGAFEPGMKPRTSKYPEIVNEARKSKLLNERGTVAMARTDDPDSATDQFFINVANNANLNPGGNSLAGYAVFGQVVEGMDTVDKIREVRTRQDVPVQDVVIRSVRRVNKQ